MTINAEWLDWSSWVHQPKKRGQDQSKEKRFTNGTAWMDRWGRLLVARVLNGFTDRLEIFTDAFDGVTAREHAKRDKENRSEECLC